MYFNYPACCGIREIADLSRAASARVAFNQYYTLVVDHGAFHRYVMFTQANRLDAARRVTYGERFTAYIRKHNLGAVIETEENINPNSGNLLKVWIWTVDHDAVRGHATELEVKAKAKPKGTTDGQTS